jgi:hypothetical protein
MELFPAVVVHCLGDAVAALEKGEPVTLLSAQGAALYAGCGWWKALVEQARAAHPAVACIDILDCADGTGQAMAALRIGLTRLVLWPEAPGRDAVAAIAGSSGGFVLAAAPAVHPPAVNSPVVNSPVVNSPVVNSPVVNSVVATSRLRPTAIPTGEGVANGDKRRPPG